MILNQLLIVHLVFMSTSINVPGITLAYNVLVLFSTVIMMRVGYDIIPMKFARVPLNIEDDNTYLRVQAWSNRDEDADILSKNVGAGSISTRSQKYGALELMYQGGNVFTADKLKAIQTLEDELTSDAQYNSSFCKIVNGVCEKPWSIIRFFDGSYGLNDPTFANISGILQAALNNPILSQRLQFHLGKNAKIDGALNVATSEITRTMIQFGGPLEGFTDLDDRSKEQGDKLEAFLADSYGDKLKDLADSGLGSMDFTYNSMTLFFHDIQRQVMLDLMLAMGSFAFIFVFMLLQTQTLFITGFALFSILSSFLAANMVYNLVLDYKYFGVFHVLSVFIILGIGADDIFVFHDTWRDTAHNSYPSLAHRLSDAYRHASVSMAITSFTTMIAFLVNAASPLLAVNSFGIFSTCIIIMNYLSVITFFPAVVVVYHLYWENWTWWCFRPCIKKQNVDPVQEHKTTKNSIKDKNFIVRFFYGPYHKFITHKIIRFVIILLFIPILILFTYYATTLTADEESIKMYKDSHNYGRAKNLRLTAFMPSQEDNVIEVYIVWGLRNQDRRNCHKTDYEDCKGNTVWDDGFDLNPKPAQTALLKFCEDLKTLNDSENVNLRIRKDTVTGLREVQCFIENVGDYLSNISTVSIPITEAAMTTFMTNRTHLYNMSAVTTNFYRYFETGMADWLYNGYNDTLGDDYRDFSEYIGQSNDTFDTLPILIDPSYSYGTRLRYAAFLVTTDIKQGSIGYEAGIPVIDAWEEFITQKMSSMPPSVAGGFQCTPDSDSWHWIKVQKKLAVSAVQGIILGLIFAFPILTFATKNIILGFLATCIITFIVVTVVGLIPMAGWKLGVLESLNLTLVVGLAVDYVVHLAEGYHRSHEKDRQGRIRDMLEHVGISVLSGALTTLGASLFMLLAVITFFMQFGIFMFGTIGFSLLYALVLFPAILAVIGPQNNTGSIIPIWIWIKYKFIGRKHTDVDCDRCTGKGFHAI